MEDGVLFVTGMQRSGTTLIEKLLGNHPELSVLSQPFPLLYVEAKRAFLCEMGEPDSPYPLGHLFLETRYGPEGFAAFLDRHRITSDQLRELFARMSSYSGQYTRFSTGQLEAACGQLPAGDGFFDTVSGLYRSLAQPSGARLYGGKETLCEEFLPYLLGHGGRCVVILRDPRDVLASLNHGRGPEYGGQIKPTLFNLRNWRKSVAFALHLEGHPGFQWLRYEDLVTDPLAALQRIAEAFGLAPVSAELVSGELRDPSGQVWSGNSSHEAYRRVSPSSVGIYRRLLSPEVSSFVEAACLPELRLLGYDASLDAADAPPILHGFEEPYETRREGMDQDVAGPASATREVRRLELLHEPPSPETTPYFLFERAHARLREAVSR
jgi:sulfotransferase family protein